MVSREPNQWVWPGKVSLRTVDVGEDLLELNICQQSIQIEPYHT